MTISGASIINKASIILQDNTNIRWPVAELVGWFNAGQREVVLYRPEASVSNTAIQLTAGQTKQTVPNTAIRLIDIVRNMGAGGTTPGRAIRLVRREIMDHQTPDWHTQTGAAEVKHFIFDTRDPKTFYVYPKPLTASYVEAILAVSPTDITESAGTVSGNLALDDVYENAILDYVLYRAYMKDSQYAGNAERAVGHYQAFANAIGMRTATDIKYGPTSNSAFNPNAPGYAVSTQQAV